MPRERTMRRGSLGTATAMARTGGPDGGVDGAADGAPVVYFDASRNEAKQLQNHFKNLHKKHRVSHRFVSSKEFLSTERLKGVKCVVLAAPQDPLDDQDITILDRFMKGGGRVLVLANEGGDPCFEHLNVFIAPHGIRVEDNAVVRTIYHKECYHPKESLVKDAVLSSTFSAQVVKHRPPAPTTAIGSFTSSLTSATAPLNSDSEEPVTVLYPFGCTLKVTADRAVPILTSGPYSLPPQAAVAAAARVGAGVLAVCGSSSLFDDNYIGRVDNGALSTALLHLLTDDTIELSLGDGEIIQPAPSGTGRTVVPITAAKSAQLSATLRAGSSTSTSTSTSASSSLLGASATASLARAAASASGISCGVDLSVDPTCPELKTEWAPVPEVEALAERLRPCLQESEELPSDFNLLFDTSIYSVDTSLVPETIALYKRLGVPHRPLSLIPPLFDFPLPSVQPAVFMPLLREAPPPALELFDLDEQFADDKLRLAQLTNKCTEKDVEYYVQAAAGILGIADAIRRKDQAAVNTTENKSTSTSSTSAGATGATTPARKISANEILSYVISRIYALKRLDGGDDSSPMPSSLSSSSSSTSTSTSAS